VIDVIDEEARVVHVCATPTPIGVGDTVEGAVDWDRRFDHMQQHSGQHLLSALLTDRYGWPTVSVHFGADTNTVDVAADTINPAAIASIEQEVNRLAAENRSIAVEFEDASQASGLRQASDRSGTLRIIVIDGIDRSACGGTHVSRTGEIGSILLRRVERTKGNTRIEFVCGLRAVARARGDLTLLNASARVFSASPADLPVLVETQHRRVTELERERKKLVADLSRFEARAYFDAASIDANGVRRVRINAVDGPVREAEPLVQAMLALGPCLVLAVSPATNGVMFGASDGSGVDAGQALRSALQSVGGRGGGSPRLAQGSAAGKLELEAVTTALGF
jgi:alanyl-tRNA synthetase